ncbi:hypothetical protein DMUE_5862 [Dictyocoela muelleri]|nr:hypothetical protein DMUE_5862 [Dictyocoela muelleri]
MDFELAPITAFKKIFPDTEIYNCFFHFSQNIWRYIQKNNLVIKYKSDKEFRINIKMLLSIAFVPKNNRITLFEKLKKNFINKFNEKLIIDLLNYFERNHLMNQNISDWGFSERVLKDIPLTTNVCEGFNRAFNSLLTGSHPSLVKLIILLRTSDHLQDNDINETISLKSTFFKKNKTIKKLENLKMIIEKYGEYYELLFLKAIVMVYDFSI